MGTIRRILAILPVMAFQPPSAQLPQAAATLPGSRAVQDGTDLTVGMLWELLLKCNIAAEGLVVKSGGVLTILRSGSLSSIINAFCYRAPPSRAGRRSGWERWSVNPAWLMVVPRRCLLWSRSVPERMTALVSPENRSRLWLQEIGEGFPGPSRADLVLGPARQGLAPAPVYLLKLLIAHGRHAPYPSQGEAMFLGHPSCPGDFR